MKITLVERNYDAPESLKSLIEKKLSKFDKFFDDSATATVTLKKRRNSECVEITINSVGLLCRAEEENTTFNNALDAATDKIERQIRKHKTKLGKRIREGAFVREVSADDLQEETDFKVREKSFKFKPMSVDEAILQMNLLDHEFFIFENEKDGKANVVYKRKDGDYGLIKQE